MHRFQIYRYDPDQDASPRMQTYDLEIDTTATACCSMC